ncbi:MAG: galactose oxidase early set domain-containing protein, partial [Gammaproteobacteria bacterium]
GGGAPGPQNNLNAEIFYPAYLYKYDGSGNPATRPTIVSGPPTKLTLGQSFSMTVGAGADNLVGYINLVRLGFNTHSYDAEQGLIPVPFSQVGTTVTGFVDSSPEKVPPGYYMVFLFNTEGHPAVAPIVNIPQAVP